MSYYAPFYQPYTNYAPNIQNGFDGQNAYRNAQFQMQQQNVPSASGLIWVDNEQQVNDYLVAPNNVVPLFHKTEPLLFVKSADGAGMVKIEKYKMVHFEETPQKTHETPVSSGCDNYATREDITAVNEKINALTAKYETLEHYCTEKVHEETKNTPKKAKGVDE